MRIAIVATDNRQHERQYSILAPYFGTPVAALLDGFVSSRGVEVHVVSCTQERLNSPDKIAENVFFHSLHVPKIGWMRTGYQGCIRAVRKRLREIGPDIVHGQGTERECAISAVFSGRPNVLTIHGNMRLIAQVNRVKPFSFHWLAAKLETLTIPRSDGVLCITNYTRDAVSDLARKTWVLPNAVDASFFEISPAPEDPAVVLCVGHISFRKNQNRFIRALDPLAQQKRFKVIFLGAAPRENPYCAEFFHFLKTRPWCEYGGLAGRNELKTFLAKATLLALPSLEDNCPMAVLEAMAAGVPVIAANVGGVPDLVEENVTGFLCDPNDPESMRATVSKTLENPARARTVAEAARNAARQRFHPRVIAERHVEIYREVLAENKCSDSR